MKKQQNIKQYLNEKLAENTNSLVSSNSTLKKKERAFRIIGNISNHTPDVLRDKEREKGAKKANKKLVHKYDSVKKQL